VLATGMGGLACYLAFSFSVSYPIHHFPTAYVDPATVTGAAFPAGVPVLAPVNSAAYAIMFGYDQRATAAITVPSLWIQPTGTFYDTTTCSLRTYTGNGVINLFMQATMGPGSCNMPRFGEAMAWLMVINAFFAGLSSVAVTGRITYAMARDNGFPFSATLSKVHDTLKTPINAITFVLIADSLLLLLPLNTGGGAAAFAAIIGLSVVFFQISYGLPVLFKLICNPTSYPTHNRLDGDPLPYQLGSWSRPMGLLSVIWLFGSCVFYFLPATGPVRHAEVDNKDALFYNDAWSACSAPLDFATNALPFANAAARTAALTACTTCPSYVDPTSAHVSKFISRTLDAANTTATVTVAGEVVKNTTADQLGSMQWLIVCFIGVIAIMIVNWYCNSRHVFIGPKRVHDTEGDVYRFLWFEFTPQFYAENYPHLTFEALHGAGGGAGATVGGQHATEMAPIAPFNSSSSS
jgi:amino acid transporter